MMLENTFIEGGDTLMLFWKQRPLHETGKKETHKYTNEENYYNMQ